MPATIVVGGQYGSEGKGKVVALLAERSNSPWLVRCGGPNSGHTVTIGGKDVVLRQVPSALDHSKATLCLAAGCAIDEDVLLGELELLKIPPDRIIVDPRAVVICEEDKDAERRGLTFIGSTCSGTGSAMARRMYRRTDVRLAADSDILNSRCRVETVAPLLHNVLDVGGDVIVEGTQGFALSLLHGPDYPFVTSRDTTAPGFAMEVGLSPRYVDHVVMVIRTFPIRVGGPSGPLPSEITWEEIAASSGAPKVQPEFTSVTKRLRRVARFDFESVKTACRYNRPSRLAVMGLDRIDFSVTGVQRAKDLSPKVRHFLSKVSQGTGVPITILGTGFRTQDSFCLTKVSAFESIHA